MSNDNVTPIADEVLARRTFLRVTALGAGVVVLGGGVLTACGGGGDAMEREAAQSTETTTNCAPTIWPLIAGQHEQVGTVTVSNDDQNLYIVYRLDQAHIDKGCTLCALHAWVGTDLANVPSNPNGTPVPGKFPYKANDGESCASITSYKFTIPLTKLLTQDISKACNTKLYVFTHAEVKCGYENETAFGGNIPVNVDEPKRWYYYGSYILCCDEEEPPPVTKCETAFAKGGYVFTTDPKSNPEGLPTLGLTKNRWGWAINLTAPGTTTYAIWSGAGLNKTSSGTRVGTLTVEWDGTEVKVTYQLSEDCGLKEVHIYAKDARPTTLAPGQYGHTAYFVNQDPLPRRYSKKLPLVDANGKDGVWLIAHAVVCCKCECKPT